MSFNSLNSIETKKTFQLNKQKYYFFDISTAAAALEFDITKLPFSLRILLENLLRNDNGKDVKTEDFEEFKHWLKNKKSTREIKMFPTRILMQDFTGVPAIVDLASMRDAVSRLNADPNLINPLTPVDLVIDHSVQVDYFGANNAFSRNVSYEMERNYERYKFLKWGQKSFSNFRVVPPGTGICHQVNLEYLAKTVWTDKYEDGMIAYPDSLVGTDSHTTMINALAVLGWGVGGIEAESAMLGQGISMVLPEVIGVRLTGSLKEGVTATDLVLTITEMLREHGVVGRFVEFFGDSLSQLSLADRATIANMAPEYGATCGFFPIDQNTLDYFELTGRSKEHIELVEHYAKLQHLWYENGKKLEFTDVVKLDLSSIKPSLAGPKRPQDRVVLNNVPKIYKKNVDEDIDLDKIVQIKGKDDSIANGSVVIAAITSCTNTSNPKVLIAAGLVARKARQLGLKVKSYVKTSFAPGSKVVTEYLKDSGLQDDLDALGFNLVGYGCTTCIGNSGPLADSDIEDVISKYNLNVASVLSGNRNFEGRIHPLVKSNFLASPPLVVAYALFGTVKDDITSNPIGISKDGKQVFLSDIWPNNQEVDQIVKKSVRKEMFETRYRDVFQGDELWRNVKIEASKNYDWDRDNTYIQNPPYFEDFSTNKEHEIVIDKAYILAIFGDSVTTDHISPAGSIASFSPAAEYLREKDIAIKDFNSYGSRRGNHEVMMRGTFANIRIRNKILQGEKEGGYTRYIPTDEILSIYDAAMRYKADNCDLVVIAGKEYGTGSSRDWAAKGTRLLGVKAVIAESFERIHRSNLIGMGVLPLSFAKGDNIESLKLTGFEHITIKKPDIFEPRAKLTAVIEYAGSEMKEIELDLCIYTKAEIEYYSKGGILQAVICNLIDNQKISSLDLLLIYFAVLLF